ncbi:MAG: hypothetical protein MJ181_04240 [Treponema sp.]|nr:hypothetical protein [Treponema sp.]
MRKTPLVLLFILSLSAFFYSCRDEKAAEITLDNSDPLALAVDVEWAVINEPYVAFRENQEWTGKDVAHGKRGEVLQVKGFSYSSEGEKWVKFEKGFLPSKSVLVFSNRFQAETSAKGMAEK